MQRSWKRVQAFFLSNYFGYGIILLGVVLRLRQYLLNRSFWADEASLAVNLVNRNFGGLTQLLDYHQAAPIGFLFIEKLSILIFGNHDYVMRLYPLFAGILAIYLIYSISRVSFGTFGLFAVSMFSITWWLVYYSSELKQYGSDVMIALLLVYLGINCLRENVKAKDFLLLGTVGMALIWISHPSVFIMVGVGLALLLEKVTRKAYVPWTWIIGVVSAGLPALD
jgi:4-amino-4-deoxy-L-arabinose transferase-like glycosyltransferase